MNTQINIYKGKDIEETSYHAKQGSFFVLV